MEVADAALLLGAATIRLGMAGLVCGDDRSAAIKKLRDALDLAETAGIAVSLFYFPGALNVALRFIREVAHPSLRLYWRAPSNLVEDGLPGSHQGVRFYVPNVQIVELTAASGRRLPKEVAYARALGAPSHQGRFAVLEVAPPGSTHSRNLSEPLHAEARR